MSCSFRGSDFIFFTSQYKTTDTNSFGSGANNITSTSTTTTVGNQISSCEKFRMQDIAEGTETKDSKDIKESQELKVSNEFKESKEFNENFKQSSPQTSPEFTTFVSYGLQNKQFTLNVAQEFTMAFLKKFPIGGFHKDNLHFLIFGEFLKFITKKNWTYHNNNDPISKRASWVALRNASKSYSVNCYDLSEALMYILCGFKDFGFTQETVQLVEYMNEGWSKPLGSKHEDIYGKFTCFDPNAENIIDLSLNNQRFAFSNHCVVYTQGIYFDPTFQCFYEDKYAIYDHSPEALIIKAAMNNNLADLSNRLSDYTKDINFPKTQFSWGLLHWAVHFGNFEMVRLLNEYRIDLWRTDIEGKPALFYANNFFIIQLIANNSDPQVVLEFYKQFSQEIPEDLKFALNIYSYVKCRKFETPQENALSLLSEVAILESDEAATQLTQQMHISALSSSLSTFASSISSSTTISSSYSPEHDYSELSQLFSDDNTDPDDTAQNIYSETNPVLFSNFTLGKRKLQELYDTLPTDPRLKTNPAKCMKTRHQS